MHNCPTVPYDDRYDPGVPPQRAAQTFYDVMRRRRSVRMFSDKPVGRDTIEALVRSACSAPSGANKQPWRFVCVSDPAIKEQVRRGAEEEERAFYAGRANEQWLSDLAPLGTDENKAFLETVPWLIVVFRLTRGDDGGPVYYSSESVGLACGTLLCAAQHAGLATLTHTPSPMNFLNRILDRPANERPFLLIPVGYPADDCVVPAAACERKPFEQSAVFHI
ncbi:MAG: nitroreductase family protein [Phycisphaeraceae bacterium]